MVGDHCNIHTIHSQTNSQNNLRRVKRHNKILLAIQYVYKERHLQIVQNSSDCQCHIDPSELYLCGKIQLKASWQYSGEYITICNSIQLKDG